jgi:hypothetical protein
MFEDEIVFGGGINTDDEARAVPKGDYRDFKYCRLGDVVGKGFTVVTAEGTIDVSEASITDADRVLGATEWLKQNAIVYFVFKADGDHEIWAYYISTQTHQLIVQSSELNFSLDYPIYHANIIDDILKWTDGRWDELMYDYATGNRLFNPPFQINLQKALDGFYGTIQLQEIDAVKWPLEPPVAVYGTDTTKDSNKLRKKLYKFMVQPVYENGEEGVWSMYSNLALPTVSEFVSGGNWAASNYDNFISVTFNTGPKVVRKLNVAVQEFSRDNFGAEPNFGVFLQLDKDMDGIGNNATYTHRFYGGIAVNPVLNLFKNYDRLPIQANCQDYLPTNQVVYANFREGFNKLESIDAQADHVLTPLEWNLSQIAFYTHVDMPDIFEFYSPSGGGFLNYDIRTSSELVFQSGQIISANLVFSLPSVSNIFLSYIVTQSDVNACTGPQPNVQLIQIVMDAFISQINDRYGIGTATQAIDGLLFYYGIQISGYVINGTATGRPLNISVQNFARPSLKTGATHEFGIVYGDRAYRDSTVYTNSELSTFVQFPTQQVNDMPGGFGNVNQPYYVLPKITISHLPPIWATHYWIVSRPATEIQDFGQYVINQGPNGGPAIQTVGDRARIILDNYYEDTNQGANIHHEIKVGDVVRFIRRRPEDVTSPTPDQCAYLTDYFELEVLAYDPAYIVDGTSTSFKAIYVQSFDYTLIDDALYYGQLLEIYTPRKQQDDTGNLFVSTWKDITESLPISNPYTDSRAHAQGEITGKGGKLSDPTGSNVVYVIGNHAYLQGYTIELTAIGPGSIAPASTPANILLAQYPATYAPDPDTKYTMLTLDVSFANLSGNVNFSWLAYNSQSQVVSSGVSTQDCELNLTYGDVYVRLRNYQTGYPNGRVFYWYIEDPHYSDYWSSNIHQTGRTRIEDNNAKMVHRQASAIHSDAFIFGTQINGLSSFALDNQNIQDMNPIYGPVLRAKLSGREGKTLKCIQPRRENSIYIQYYPSQVEEDTGNLRVSNKTFASWFDYKSLYGVQNAGAVVMLPNGSVIYFDANVGAFVMSSTNGQSLISENNIESGTDRKFRTKSKTLAKQYNSDPYAYVRTYVNERMNEAGFCFGFTQYEPIEVSVTGTLGNNEIVYPGNLLNLRDDNEDNFVGYSAIVSNSTNSAGFSVTAIGYDSINDETIIELSSNISFVTDLTFYMYPIYTYDIVVYDYVRDRWCSTYDYNFVQFAWLGQTLMGWGFDNSAYIHNNANSFTFHGQSFVQQISFVSNENPLALKRYQDMTQRANQTFDVSAFAEENQSYSQMATEMPSGIFSVYEGYSKCYYKRNQYTPNFATQDLAMMNGEEIRANALTHVLSYDPTTNGRAILFNVGITGVLS